MPRLMIPARRTRKIGLRATVAAACATALPAAAFATAAGGARDTAARSARTSCPTSVNANAFADASEFRRLSAKLTSFGLRSPGSAEHNRALAWIEREMRAIRGMRIRSDYYTINRWQPLPQVPGRTPGRDLARAGGLKIDNGGAAQTLPVAGALPFTLPTSVHGRPGKLVYLPDDQPITAANARGRIIVREVPPASIAYVLFRAIAHYATPDMPTSGDYKRPYFRQIDPTLIDAGKAGAAGVVFLWDVPTAQVRGYWEPHTGTRFRVPAVYAGNDQAARLRRLAQEGASAHIIVRAKWDRVRTRNLIATLTGQTRERIVVNTHTDGVTWVQENGSVGAIALARYLARLPLRCRHRDVQFALTSDHLGFTGDGTFRYGKQLDKDYAKGTVAFVMSIEHLGTREILPTGPNNTLRFTGRGEPIAWSAPEESPTLVRASVDAVKRRRLDHTVVLKGVEAPVADRVPQFCSQGGLGTNFNSLLIPTISTITGPWSLWAPSFGERAIDFGRMRREVLATGDVARALDRVPRAKIAGSYMTERQKRAKGAKTCDLTPPPAVAPAS